MKSIFEPVSPDVWIGHARFRTLHDSEDYDLVESVQPEGEQTPSHRHVYAEYLFRNGSWGRY